jgi:hypothetical protein
MKNMHFMYSRKVSSLLHKFGDVFILILSSSF